MDALGDYLDVIGRIPLLTAQEEITLGKSIQEGLEAQKIPADQQTKKHKRTLIKAKRAKDRMIQGNLRLVVVIARKWSKSQISLEMSDLVQEGTLGLIRAVEKFDPSRGYKFSTYAYWWIRQGIGRCISYQNRMIRLPGTALSVLGKAKDFALAYKAQHDREPSKKEVASHCGVTEETLGFYLMHRSGCASLDTPAVVKSDKKEMSDLIQIIADPVSLEEISFFDVENEEELIHYIHNQLTSDEREVICRRYGIGYAEPQTLEYVGRQLHFSRERIRQVEKRALKKLRIFVSRSSVGMLRT